MTHGGVDGATIVVLVHIKMLIDSLLLFIQLLIDLVLSSEMSDVGQHNDASDMDDFQDGVVEMEPRSRYDEKEDKKIQEKRGLIIDQVNTFLDAILHHPELWAKPELKKTREFVEIVSHDPVHFPLTLPLSSLHNEEATQPVPELTKGFAKSVYDGAIRDDHDVGNLSPVVVVTAAVGSKVQ